MERVLARAQAEHARHEAYDLHSSLAILAEAQDDLVAAVRHLRATREVQAKLHEDRERLRLAQEDMRLELARMQVEAASLRNHQRELARVNQALAASDAAHQKLLRTLAPRPSQPADLVDGPDRHDRTPRTPTSCSGARTRSGRPSAG